ncbi:unnamed protein product [Prorocentrum cordatum]|uniref:Uncharacterized protein n=1 Tax=Prorocentrum cordatum TaxID=2364126 RepID=A0ABN9TR79_9DINO|nr:unnamed protein product [Polarella glacialis]
MHVQGTLKHNCIPTGWRCLSTGVDVAAGCGPLQARCAAAAALQLQRDPPPLAQYLVLRFGAAAPLCRDAAHLFGTSAGFEGLRAQMRARDVIRDYVALKHGDVRAPIDDSTFAVQARCRVHASGQDAVTVYEVVDEYSDGLETYSLATPSSATRSTWAGPGRRSGTGASARGSSCTRCASASAASPVSPSSCGAR